MVLLLLLKFTNKTRLEKRKKKQTTKTTKENNKRKFCFNKYVYERGIFRDYTRSPNCPIVFIIKHLGEDIVRPSRKLLL
jgi:hypothetical protein